ncbi:hypothetical protein E1508_09460 [Pseudomonas moraviensis]|nr:hypothetical protein E1508_09460 [Pseudomonas moraviensis]
MRSGTQELGTAINASPYTYLPCGSWLASDEDLSANIYVTDTPLSLASQLPQVLWFDPNKSLRAAKGTSNERSTLGPIHQCGHRGHRRWHGRHRFCRQPAQA